MAAEDVATKALEKTEKNEVPVANKHVSWHAVYKINNRNDMVNLLSLLSSSLQAEEETLLRTHLTDSKIFLSDESLVATLEPNQLIEDQDVQLYTNIIMEKSKSTDDETKDRFLICLLVNGTSGFDLFQKDLDKYCDLLLPHLMHYMKESTDITKYLELLESWYERNLCFIKRCLLQVSEEPLAALICASFSGNAVVFGSNVVEDIRIDLERFIECCSLSNLFSEISTIPGSPTSSIQDLAFLHNTQNIDVNVNEDMEYSANPLRVTSFCNDCIRSLKTIDRDNPIKMRQMLENYKLKCIQDMNTFKRLMKQAEGDHYTLYKAYLFLLSCGNGEVILGISNLQNTIDNSKTTKQVLDVLETFIKKSGGFEALTVK